jgi:hypothetical protein
VEERQTGDDRFERPNLSIDTLYAAIVRTAIPNGQPTLQCRHLFVTKQVGDDDWQREIRDD